MLQVTTSDVAPKGCLYLPPNAPFRLVRTGFDSNPNHRRGDIEISL
jgi:hypothetical protein